MANLVSLSGADTLTLEDRVFADFATEDWIDVKFANELAALKTGKNGNTIYAQNTTGQQADVVMRLIMGSPDDVYLQGRFAEQSNDFSSFVLLGGSYVKKVGDGAGKVGSITYALTGGIFIKCIEAKSNAEGDVNQSVAIWTMKFSAAPRAISAPAAG